jgi:hypothetical protein
MSAPFQTLGYVYLVTNLVNGKKYVECTERTVERRWTEHQNLAKRGSPSAIHAAIRKYDVASFRVEVLEVVEGPRADLLVAEVRQIAAQDCLAPKGYNLTSGGDGVDFTVPLVRERHLEAVRKSAADPARQETFRKRSSDPTWVTANAEKNRRLATDPEWLKATAPGLAKTRASIHANALARDGLHPPEVQAMRVKNRARALKSYHKRKIEKAAQEHQI